MVLAGGVGSRFWPVSTPHRPKQLLPLGGDRPLLAQTIDRIRPLVPLERIRVLAGRSLAEPILRAIPDLGPDNLWLEPRARGTAPVLAWAAAKIVRTDPGAVMISLHADHIIEPAARFRDQLGRVAAACSEARRLCTLGVAPTRPETGYGYVQVGPVLPEEGPAGLRQVLRFVEKPDRPRAEEYLRSGEHLWNTGLFVWPAALLLDQLRTYTPEMAALLPLLEQGREEEFFRLAPLLSIDEGLLERSDRVAVARADFAWDDVGAWDAVARTHPADGAGNVAVGDAWLADSRGCIAWAEDGALALYGTEDLVVVHAHGVTLVTPRSRAADLKSLLSRLPERLREPDRG
jgi:mannose-1-phosphate guanylyltransferase